MLNNIIFSKNTLRKAKAKTDHPRASVKISKHGTNLTSFITPFGRFRYTRAPQGFVSSGDGYNRRFAAILSDFEKKK